MSMGKKHHAGEKLDCSSSYDTATCNVFDGGCGCAVGAAGCSGSPACPGSGVWSCWNSPEPFESSLSSGRSSRLGSEDTPRSHPRSAESSRRWSRPVTRPSSSAEAGSRGHGPGRPGAQPVGAECRGAPGRGSAERAGEVAARRPRPRPPGALRHLLMLLLLSSVFRIADGCSSRANPKPRGPSSPSTRRPSFTFNTEPCPPMYQAKYCLHGSRCFKVNIGHNPVYSCECTDGFMGQRCEYKDPDGFYPRSRDAIVEQASIAGGAGVALLVCLLLSGLLYVWSKRRSKSAASSGQVTPRFGLRQPTSHVVEMEPPTIPAAANQQPSPADVIELQPVDRWTPPQPPATQTVPQDTPAGEAPTAAPAAAPVAAPTAPAAPGEAPQATGAGKEPTGSTDDGNSSHSDSVEPQSRQCDRPP
ncbi:uncharacterized protein LOC122370161 isoform X2 [Amphibalanus amphitrite]|uniref:uncharacterized protein LOC122370161 isoform X2 n=1 Tax=Amphibalanus amphitrite TaxID=1232801 RepID=UPI001C919174|nr:uncharacterized protein LOC122370161 isoform X2 [Amphibalanus amphitrite]